jgi:predicted NBD/HSP70 family sugar kinase
MRTLTQPSSVRTGSNLPKVRARNLSVVLDALRRLQPISRSDLALATELTPATMTNLVGELTALGLVLETPAETRQIGRRPSLLTFNHRAGCAIGIEISRREVRGVLSDLSGNVLARAERAHGANVAPDAVLASVNAIVARLKKSGAPLGIGVGVPGPVDTEAGVVLEPPNFPGWQAVPLGTQLRARWGVSVWLDDDAKTAALGERWFGAGRGFGGAHGAQNLLYVSIGEGIGAGLIVRDRLYRGTHDLAGEIGHTTLDLDGPLCECGNRGCLEMLVSIPALLRTLGGVSSIEEVHALAVAGDVGARALKERAYRYLAAGVGNAVNFYDPDLIVLGGALIQAWPELCAEITTRVRGRSFAFASRDVQIQAAQLGADSSALGAASLVIEQVINTPALLQDPSALD